MKMKMRMEDNESIAITIKSVIHAGIQTIIFKKLKRFHFSLSLFFVITIQIAVSVL